MIKPVEDLRSIQVLANHWTNDISPPIKEVLFRLEAAVENATQMINSTTPGYENITSILNNITIQIQRYHILIYNIITI